MGEEEAVTVRSSSSAPAIDSSNIGFQRRLEPIRAYLKDNKRGIGADTSTNKFLPVSEISDSSRRKYEKEEEGMGNGMMSSSCSSTAINSSNIGFQLLKKHGWKEGTGLGISEQLQKRTHSSTQGMNPNKHTQGMNPNKHTLEKDTF
ncbi:unnamed protein product [Malus baccata var. baccata]